MKTLTYEQILTNPEILDVLHAQARRARSQAFANAVVALSTGIRKRLAPNAGIGRLIARMG